MERLQGDSPRKMIYEIGYNVRIIHESKSASFQELNKKRLKSVLNLKLTIICTYMNCEPAGNLYSGLIH